MSEVCRGHLLEREAVEKKEEFKCLRFAEVLWVEREALEKKEEFKCLRFAEVLWVEREALEKKRNSNKTVNIAVMCIGSTGPSGALGTAVIETKREIDDVEKVFRGPMGGEGSSGKKEEFKCLRFAEVLWVESGENKRNLNV